MSEICTTRAFKEQGFSLNDVPELSGKLILVTGGNQGIGYEVCKAFAVKRATVVMACRSEEKGQQAVASIKQELSEAGVDYNVDLSNLVLDVSSLQSINTFVDSFSNAYGRLNILINNAGMICPDKQFTADGFEMQMGTNHLGPFYLTNKLFPLLVKASGDSQIPSRVVNVSSIGERSGDLKDCSKGVMDFDESLYGGEYSQLKCYERTKLANQVFTQGLKKRILGSKDGSLKKKVLVTVCHPGMTDGTALNRNSNGWWRFMLDYVAPVVKFFRLVSYNTPALGALNEVRAAVDPEAEMGQFFGPQNTTGGPCVVLEQPLNPVALDETLQDQLWTISEEMTGAKFEV